MSERVPRNGHHVEFEPEVFKRSLASVVQCLHGAGHLLSSRPEDRRIVPGRQRSDTADMVGVVMRDEDGAESQPCGLQGLLHGTVVARIDYDCGARVGRRAYQPDVVVRKRPHRAHLQHVAGDSSSWSTGQ